MHKGGEPATTGGEAILLGMAGDQAANQSVDHGPIGLALSTSVRGNSTAFGFSIMITASFGALTTLRGSANLLEILLFGVAAAAVVAALEGVVTRGFRRAVSEAPSEVRMLGTAMNFASVAAGVATAMGIGEIVGGVAAWPAGGSAAAAVYVLVESAELLLAEGIQRLRGDPSAGEEEGG